MRKIKWYLDTGYAGADYEGEFEVEDDATDKEIDEEAREYALEKIEWGWQEEKE